MTRSAPSAEPAPEQGGRGLCTIVASNYVSLARTLVASERATSPASRWYVLVLDDFSGRFDPAAEPFTVITPSQLPIPFSSFAFKYDVMELATAVKPFLLEHLLVEGGLEEIVYLDPDVYVLSPLEELSALLHHHDFVLTPHRLHDESAGIWAIESSLRTGVFNLGFLALRRSDETRALLSWWQRKVFDHCVMDERHGLFVDQKFMDLSLTLFEGGHVLKHPGYNLATWNFDERRLSENDAGVSCAGKPLRFVHFSGYRPLSATALPAREWFPRDEIWLRLFERYRRALFEHGLEESRRWAYQHERFRRWPRLKVHPRLRALYRRSPRLRERVPAPFASARLQLLAALAWMVEAPLRLVRLLRRAHEQ